MRFSFDISGICCCIPIIALVGLLVFFVLKKQSGSRSHSHSSGVYWGSSSSDDYSSSNDSHWSSDSNSGDSSGSWGDSGGSSDGGSDSSD